MVQMGCYWREHHKLLLLTAVSMSALGSCTRSLPSRCRRRADLVAKAREVRLASNSRIRRIVFRISIANWFQMNLLCAGGRSTVNYLQLIDWIE